MLQLLMLLSSTATVLHSTAAATLRSGEVHVEENFAPPMLVQDLRNDIDALSDAGGFSAAGSGGRAGEDDTLRSAQFCDPIQRDRMMGDFEAFYCLWERLDIVRQELSSDMGCELLPEMEVHYVRYQQGGFYGKHLDDYVEEAPALAPAALEASQAPRSSRRRFSFICYLSPPDSEWAACDGGALRAYDQDGSAHVDHLPTSGKLVLFDSCAVEHEVLPTMRERTCLIGWFHEAVPP